MTHDELLAKINEIENIETYKSYRQFIAATRAVVELHKPNEYGKCYCNADQYDGTSLMNWPCETIQAIEKELK